MESSDTPSEVLRDVVVRPIAPSETARYQAHMSSHHSLGALSRIGESVWYVATWRDEWIAQLSMSAAALKCAAHPGRL